jgi:hypothetical protein
MNVERVLLKLNKLKSEMELECLYKTNVECKAKLWLELVEDTIASLDGK